MTIAPAPTIHGGALQFEIELIDKLNRDLRKAASHLSTQEARYLVDTYYQFQQYRIASNNQIRAQEEHGEPHSLVTWIAGNMGTLEKNIKSALDAYSSAHTVGVWAKNQLGIGPVIAAGLIAHIDPEKCKTAGATWKFAGLDPTSEWKKGQKRPWNAELKVLCWKIGESFVKLSNKEECFYGQIYKKRKEFEAQRNELCEFKDQAEAILKNKKISKNTEAYKWYSQGKLPPAHIHARAKRVAVKLFISHFCHVYWESTTGEKPPLPYAVAILKHADVIEPPGWPLPTM